VRQVVACHRGLPKAIDPRLAALQLARQSVEFMALLEYDGIELVEQALLIRQPFLDRHESCIGLGRRRAGSRHGDIFRY
jgi:hypothetical protein